jgi:hypothetical protein
VSAWTTTAWQQRRPTAQLWWATLLPSFHADWGALNEEVGLFPEDTAPETPEAHAAAVLHCTGTVARRKAAAMRAHASQVGPLLERVGGVTFDQWWSVETFVAASEVLVGPT